MFDFSLSEFLVVGVVAVAAIGPKEMPVVVRKIAKFVRTIRHFVDNAKREVLDAVEGLDDAPPKREGEKPRRFILADDGHYREVFDISEVLEETKTAKAEPVSKEQP